MYLNGEGVAKDYKKALEYLEGGRGATDKGVAGRAYWNLATIYAKGLGVLVDKNQATEYSKQACDEGYEKACTLLSK
ncbi:hypothetical protein [Helicobacter felistomachi]|uniref:hypothetical protein n=1 Tax=Helicobacter felistomachi TaxID=3040201 RepID=UPI0025743908|nr:hypothetical protein [Helicobacter sp. NHP21005]